MLKDIPDFWNRMDILMAGEKRPDGNPLDATALFKEVTGNATGTAIVERWGSSPREGRREKQLAQLPESDLIKLSQKFAVAPSLLAETLDADAFSDALVTYRSEFLHFDDLLNFPFGPKNPFKLAIDIQINNSEYGDCRVNPLRGMYDHHSITRLTPRQAAETQTVHPGDAIRISVVARGVTTLFVFLKDSKGWLYLPIAEGQIAFTDKSGDFHVPNDGVEENSRGKMIRAQNPYYVSATPGPNHIVAVARLPHSQRDAFDERVHEKLKSKSKTRASSGRALLLAEMNNNPSNFVSSQTVFYTLPEP